MEVVLYFIITFSKLDPLIKGLLQTKVKFAPPPPRVSVMIYTSDKFRLSEGLRLKKVLPERNVYMGSISIGDLENLYKNPEVKYIHLSRKLRPLLDYNAERTGFTRIVKNEGLVGKGVVVGIVDTGIDLLHPDLTNDDGSVRISFIWDQTKDGTPPDGFDYGTACDAYEINIGSCEIDFRDTYGHGTHISGILLSDDEVYTGLITQSVPVFVKTGYDENQIIDAVKYIFSIAERYSLPAVVNLSLGGHFGPHDGTSMFEEAISSLTGSGRIIVVSAGNDGNKDIHVRYPVATTEGILLNIPSFLGIGGTAVMEFWYEKNDYIDFRVVALDESNSVIDGTSWLSPGEDGRFTLLNESAILGECYIDATVDSYPFSKKRYVYIEIKSYDPAIRWGILQKPSVETPSTGTLHGWLLSHFAVITSEDEKINIDEGGNTFVVNTHSPDSYYTVMVPATAKDVIAVGSYVGRTEWRSLIGEYSESITEGVLSPFSSKGPSLNPFYTGLKPLIIAPGQWVLSILSSYLSGVPSYQISNDGMHYALDGTSVSTPFVTALAVALLEKNPYLTPEEIIDIICDTALSDEFTGDVPSAEWGCGKIQPDEAVSHLGSVDVEYSSPQVLEVKMVEEGVYVMTDTLTQVSIIDGDKVHTDNSYAERHLVKGTKGDAVRIVVKDVWGRVYTVEAALKNSGCGCVESGSPFAFVEFMILFLTFRTLTANLLRIYASNRD